MHPTSHKRLHVLLRYTYLQLREIDCLTGNSWLISKEEDESHIIFRDLSKKVTIYERQFCFALKEEPLLSEL